MFYLFAFIENCIEDLLKCFKKPGPILTKFRVCTPVLGGLGGVQDSLEDDRNGPGPRIRELELRGVDVAGPTSRSLHGGGRRGSELSGFGGRFQN